MKYQTSDKKRYNNESIDCSTPPNTSGEKVVKRDLEMPNVLFSWKNFNRNDFYWLEPIKIT